MKRLIVHFTLYTFIFISSTLAQNQPLCDVDGISQEITKAIEILKIKALEKPSKGDVNQLRQDDDDDGDIPYYVPAIAKVVASVLAQNATNVIEESFGFIPPEVNKNIRYVLGLVAETVAKLRPTPAPTEAPIPTTQPTTPVPIPIATNVSISEVVPVSEPVNGPGSSVQFPNQQAQTTNIEDILAYALAQQLISTPTRTATAEPVFKSVETEVPLTTASPSTEPTNAPELFTSTFKYSEGNSVTSGPGLVAVSDELHVYAPAYAPNYGVTSTKSSMYAAAFNYDIYKPSEAPNATVNSVSLNSTTAKTVDETTSDPEGTTEDYYDENVTDSEEVAAVVTTSSSSGTKLSKVTSATIPTTSPEEEDEYDDTDNINI